MNADQLEWNSDELTAKGNRFHWKYFVIPFVLVSILCPLQTAYGTQPAEQDRPNILWITSEDNGPHLGCYGDSYATTPQLDKLAGIGCVYRNVWSNAPVCAPARTALITGMYPTSLGAENMRTMVSMPKGTRMFPQLLREQGYYCTNNSKEDYNVRKPGKIWDESSKKADWKNREENQPFFAVYNFTVSHESRIRKRPHRWIHDPAKARIPAYHPDHEWVRKDWAQYYDQVSKMDEQAGKRLEKLEKDGLSEETIIFYFGDHGSGMPRSKRFPGNSGLHVPLLVYIPRKFATLRSQDYQPQGESDRLVSFVDFGPTVLSLAGIKPPNWMQGKAFLGKYQQEPKPHLFGFRGRMDERYDLVRVARDKRYLYRRNFYPHLPHGQYIQYQFQTPTTKLWFQQFRANQLNKIQSEFWQRKPIEALYDLEVDPDETVNLVKSTSSQHQDRLQSLREACLDWCVKVNDLGFVPEPDLHSGIGNRSPRDVYTQKPQIYEKFIRRVFALRPQKYSHDFEARIRALLHSKDPHNQFWGLQTLIAGQRLNFSNLEKDVRPIADQNQAYNRVLANALLAKHGKQPESREKAMEQLLLLANLEKQDSHTVLMALNALDYLDGAIQPFRDQIRELPTSHPDIAPRSRNYPKRLVEKILADLRQ